MHRVRTASTVLALAAVAAVGLSAPAQAAGTRTSFTVDTQFVAGDSMIVAASGPLATCTSVSDASNEPQGRTHSQALFTGNKILHCGESTVVIGYEAFISFPAPPASGGAFTTHGKWWVEESDLPGVTSGGGTLMGDSRRCELAAGSEGCILDTFMGSVS
jgi:hypothetical protein